MKLVIASNNKGKLEQLKAWLPDYTEVLSMADIGFRDSIPEPFESFQENAYIKAKTVYDFCGLPVLSDDSGICVDALDGAPGVYSARYAGEDASDAANNEKLLRSLAGEENRRAHYFAVLCLMLPDGAHYFEGRCDGHIGCESRGSGGFGYDPLFIPDGYAETFAMLSPEEKSRISHRARALEQLSTFLNRLAADPSPKPAS
jgi:XTP/dITP diphosphohydrolase